MNGLQPSDCIEGKTSLEVSNLRVAAGFEPAAIDVGKLFVNFQLP